VFTDTDEAAPPFHSSCLEQVQRRGAISSQPMGWRDLIVPKVILAVLNFHVSRLTPG